MDFLSVKPGLLFWSLVNFILFLVALYFIGGKNFIKNIVQREKFIQDAIDEAEQAQLKAKNIDAENEQKIKEAFKSVDEIVRKGKEQADAQANMIIEKAEKSRNNMIRQANEEIERNKHTAMKDLRNEVADLVMGATEKVLKEKIDSEKDKELINTYINELPENE